MQSSTGYTHCVIYLNRDGSLHSFSETQTSLKEDITFLNVSGGRVFYTINEKTIMELTGSTPTSAMSVEISSDKFPNALKMLQLTGVL